MQFPLLYSADSSILQNEDIYNSALCLLSDESKDKTNKLRFQTDRRTVLASELLLKNILNSIGIKDYTIYKTENGKPYLKDKYPFFNISHSGNRVLCAVSDKEIGCDIQKIKPYSDNILSVAEKNYHPKEYTNILAIKNNDEKNRLFYRYWALKESFAKATGYGLDLPFKEFYISLENKEITVFQNLNNRQYYLQEYFDFLDYSCAVCSEKPLSDTIITNIELKNILNKI